ncbi:MAG: HD domain-containing protein [Patescibacteria group bacterium]
MKNSLNFLIEVNKLKEMPRTGWILQGAKNPETIAEHTVRMAFTAWLLGREKKLNIKKLIKLAIFHDLCEVYAGDNTPFFYYQNLEGREGEKAMLKGPRLAQKEKKKLGEKKFILEKNALLKLISPLNLNIKKDIFSSWLDFEKKFSPEGRFVREIDRIETLLQSIEYFGNKEKIAGSSWWEQTEEFVEDPFLLEFLKIIQNRFYGKRFLRNKKLENILDFIVEIGKLKRMPRLYWKLRGVKNPETIAGHIFTLMLMVLIFGREKKQLNMEKLLKMALCHEITAVYTKDTIPYDINFPKDKKELAKILEKAPYSSKDQKTKKFLKDYQEEKESIKRLFLKLPGSLESEIIQLWDEYRNRSSSESRFLAQLNVLAILLQGLLYKRREKKFSVSALWEWVFEICDDPCILALMDEMKGKL